MSFTGNKCSKMFYAIWVIYIVGLMSPVLVDASGNVLIRYLYLIYKYTKKKREFKKRSFFKKKKDYTFLVNYKIYPLL